MPTDTVTMSFDRERICDDLTALKELLDEAEGMREADEDVTVEIAPEMIGKLTDSLTRATVLVAQYPEEVKDGNAR